MVGRARQFYEPALISPVHLKDGILVPPQDAPILAVVVRVPKVCSHAAGARERRRRGGEGGQRGARTVLAVIYAQTHLSLEEDARNSTAKTQFLVCFSFFSGGARPDSSLIDELEELVLSSLSSSSS